MTNTNVLSYQRKQVVPNPVMAVIMVIIVEVMFFGGLISAYVLARVAEVEWPPAGQPRLPFWLTFSNMLVLLASGALMNRFLKTYKSGNKSLQTLSYSALLGILFFLVQGFEWMRILLFGVKAEPSLFGSFFYMLIGMHGLHVLAGLLTIGYLFKYLKNRKKSDEQKTHVATAVAMFWYFVVLLWPILYYLTYLV